MTGASRGVGRGVAIALSAAGYHVSEAVVAAAEAGVFDLSNSESPEFIGRVILALAGSPETLNRSGSVVVAAQAAIELGVTDLDGTQPKPLTIDAV